MGNVGMKRLILAVAVAMFASAVATYQLLESRRTRGPEISAMAGGTPILNGYLQSNLNGSGFSVTNASNFVLSSGVSLTGAQATATSALSLGNGTTQLTTAKIEGYPDKSVLVGFETVDYDGIYIKHGTGDWRRETSNQRSYSWATTSAGNGYYADGTEATAGRWKLVPIVDGSEADADVRASNPADPATHPGAVAEWEYWDGVDTWVTSGGSGYNAVLRDVLVKVQDATGDHAANGIYTPQPITVPGEVPTWKCAASGATIAWNSTFFEIDAGDSMFWNSEEGVVTPDLSPTWNSTYEDMVGITVTALSSGGVNVADALRTLNGLVPHRKPGTTGRVLVLNDTGGYDASAIKYTDVMLKTTYRSLGARGYGSGTANVSGGFPTTEFDANNEFNSYLLPESITSLKLYCYTTAHSDANKGGSWYAYVQQYSGTGQTTVSTNIGTITKSSAGAQFQLVTIPITGASSLSGGPYSLYLVWKTNTTAAASITNIWVVQATYIP